MMKLLYKCAICSAEYGLNGFTNHIQRTHKIKYKDYYDTYVDTNEHMCPYCGKPCAFTNYAGYRKTCGDPHCAGKAQNATSRARYGESCRRPETMKPKPTINYKYTCALCGGGYNILRTLNRHINKAHPEITVENYHIRYLGVIPKTCEICGKRAKWLGVRYHIICDSPECTHVLRSKHNAMNNPEYKEKAIQGQLNMTEEQKRAKDEKRAATCMKKYGVAHNWQSKECREKCKATTKERYGTSNGFQLPRTRRTIEKLYGVSHFSRPNEFAKRRKKKYYQDGIGFDSKDEIMVYNFTRITGHSVELQPEDRFTYEARGKTHYYVPDFKIDGNLYEVKGRQFFQDKDPSKQMINPYDRSMDDIYEAKHHCMLANGVTILTGTTIFDLVEQFYGIHTSEDSIVTICAESDFPGTSKWPENHPIWDCFVPGHSSPRDAWNNRSILVNSVKNLVQVLANSLMENKYHSFVRRHIDALRLINTDTMPIRQLVLNRFTVAKIAPKVTALRATDLLKIIEESGKDLSAGVYCPMAGFGGIVEGAKKWFKTRGLKPDIEAYDINKNFCEWYGWTQRDVLAQTVTTDKTVVVCPPFGKKYEHWKGTPDAMSDIDFIDWVKLIKEHVKAPDYIFIGPEPGTKKTKCGLFAKKVGIALYKEGNDVL